MTSWRMYAGWWALISALLLPGCGEPAPIADDMVQIPAGSYTIGRDDGFVNEAPPHLVTLSAFEIDRYEVTNREFKRFVNADDCPGPLYEGAPDPCVYDGAVQSNTRIDYYSNGNYSFFPVLNVRWDQAEAYCRWKGKRLPTEAEWETAARGPEALLYPWGNDAPDCTLANYEGCTPDAIRTDEIEAASPFGVIQMAGNVAEWTADNYNDTYYEWGPTENPQGPERGASKVVRGGSWYCPANKVTATFRDQADPKLQYNTVGFRCARSLDDGAETSPTTTP